MAEDLNVLLVVLGGVRADHLSCYGYDRPTTPATRAGRHNAVTAEDKKTLADVYPTLNPAAIQRKVQALTAQLLTLTTAKARATPKPPAERPSTAEQTTPVARAS